MPSSTSPSQNQPTPSAVKVVDGALVGFILSVTAVIGAGAAGLF